MWLLLTILLGLRLWGVTRGRGGARRFAQSLEQGRGSGRFGDRWTRCRGRHRVACQLFSLNNGDDVVNQLCSHRWVTEHYVDSTTMGMLFQLWFGYQNVALENLVSTLPPISCCDHENIRNMACKEILLAALKKKSSFCASIPLLSFIAGS